MTRNSAWCLAVGLAATLNLQAQPAPKPAEKSTKKEIVLEEHASGKKEKMIIMIEGDKVTINGKPAEDYKGKKRIVIGDDIRIDGETIELPRNGGLFLHDFESQPRPLLGVTTEKSDKGAEVKMVREGSAAEKAGLKAGDIITQLEGSTVASPTDLMEAVQKAKPDQKVGITYLRDGKTNTTTATLGKAIEEMAFDWNFGEGGFETAMARLPRKPVAPRINSRIMEFPAPPDFPRISPMRPKYGFSLEDNADADGVKVTDVEANSSAEKAGLKVGDLLTAINDKPVKNIDALRVMLAANKDANSHSVTVLRNGTTQTLTLRVPKIIKKADF